MIPSGSGYAGMRQDEVQQVSGTHFKNKSRSQTEQHGGNEEDDRKARL